MQKHLIAALIAGALAAPAFAQNVAIVNGKPIPQARLDSLVTQFKEQAKRMNRPEPSEDEIKRMKEEIVLREIFLQEAEKQGLDKKPEFAKRMEVARESILISELMEHYQKTHPVTDEQARAEYDRIVKLQRDSVSGRHEYKASHILVEKEDEAKAIIAKLKKGEKFDAIAKKQSKDPGSGSKGGDLGWAMPDTYVKEFAEAVQKLKKGELTETPVKTQYGYHVIKMEDIRDAQPPEMPKFEDVKDQVAAQLSRQNLSKYQEDLRAKAKVE
ncbi:MAG: peptidylprolyl isomerase [Ottowia sp.]